MAEMEVTQRGGRVTNAEIYDLLTQFVGSAGKRLAAIEVHLATQNGNIAANAKAIVACEECLTEISKSSNEACVRLAVLEERDKQHGERLAEHREDLKSNLAKLWDIAWKLSAVIAAVGVMTKLGGLW